LKEEIEGLLGTGESPMATAEPLMVGFVGRLAPYMLQVAIEAEATAFLGRGHYRRGDRQRVGWRNGYEPKHVQTGAGALELAVPQLRGTDEAFRPTIVDRLRTERPISRDWFGACTCAGPRPRTSARSITTRSARAT
jgi:transposase-like protein